MPFLYPRDIESKLGFDSVRSLLREMCQSPMGVAEADAMAFSADWREVVARLRRVAEMKAMYESGEAMPEVSFCDLGSWLPALKVEGSYASPEEFLRLRRALVSFENARTCFMRREGKDADTPLLHPALAELFSGLELFPDLVRAVGRVVDDTGQVKDSASPELAEVRQKIASMQGSMARAVQRVFAQAVRDGLVDKDTAPSLRDGRMVIPVPAANKRRVNGIVHDESATGKTVFIEPAETVELSNRMRELEMEERRIVVRVLTELASVVRPEIDAVLASNMLLGRLDFIMAKARFALDTGGELPVMERRPEIDWYGAVHPGLLLSLRRQGRPVVPLALRLDGKRRILVVSGPNAGGKSVALKTVGIVQYMCQCGLLPTLHSNSHMGFFSRMFVDIGDEQSIENDLSTYSSHLRNMRQFLLHADSKSLVLIDEIGSGTEPNIGSALAKAILAKLASSRCYGVVTTHYHSLKKFAEEAEGFVNGAMLYDRSRLQPTFQLSVGNPGSSFALEIAGKIGLPRDVIEMAKQDVGEDYVESDRFLMEIARDRKYWQSKRDSIRVREARLEEIEKKYETLMAELAGRRKEIIREAQDEARQLLSGANRKIENTIREIREAEAERERTLRVRRELEDFRREVEEAGETAPPALDSPVALPSRRKTSKRRKGRGASTSGADDGLNAVASRLRRDIPKAKPSAPEAPAELSVGDYVRMEGSTSVGRILSISGKEAEVALGQLRTVVKLSRLTRTQAPASDGLRQGSGYTLLNGSGSSDMSRQRQLEFRDELDIRGARADEALDRVARFIDDAIQFGVGRVRILHGTGAGILRQLVRQQLGATPGVVRFADEDVRLGGAGVTVVDL